jgi:hypothetical protein
MFLMRKIRKYSSKEYMHIIDSVIICELDSINSEWLENTQRKDDASMEIIKHSTLKNVKQSFEQIIEIQKTIFLTYVTNELQVGIKQNHLVF